IPYRSFKDLKLGHGFSGTVIPVIVLIVLLIEPGLNFFLVGLAYVASGPAGMLWRWKTGQELLPAQSPEDIAAAEAVGPASARGPGGLSGRGTHPGQDDAGSARSVWDELDREAENDEGAQVAGAVEAGDAARGATNVMSLADYGSSGGTRGEGGR
ncbi:hypothetical protein K2X89_06285, partial [Myxococcota bacterium]|nr:hypothetical protein [Myxococcota bacterium]